MLSEQEILRYVARQPRRIARDDERRDAPGPRLGGRPGEHDIDVGVGRIRDEDLGPAETEAGAVSLGFHRQGAGIGTRVRLSQCKGSDRLTARFMILPAR